MKNQKKQITGSGYVPSKLLVQICQWGLCPLVLVFAVLGLGPVCWVLLVLALLIGVIDWLRSRELCGGVQLLAPDVMDGLRGRELKLVFGVQKLGKTSRGQCVLDIPDTLEVTENPVYFEAKDGQASWEYHFKPLRRGTISLEVLSLAFPSAWGLWEIRRIFHPGTRIRIYPDSRSAMEEATIYMKKNGHGLRMTRLRGHGKEFDSLREYLPGDNFDDIDWKATARRRMPIIREYRAEQRQAVIVAIDASRLGGRGADDEASDQIFERFLQAAMTLAWVAGQAGDDFGLAIFDEKIRHFVKAGFGGLHLQSCRNALAEATLTDTMPDYDEVASELMARIPRRSLLVFLTSLDDPAIADSFRRNVRLLSGKHVVLADMVRPSSVAPMFSQEAPDDAATALAGHLQWARLQKLARELQSCGVQFRILEDKNLCGQITAQYLSIKKRQAI